MKQRTLVSLFLGSLALNIFFLGATSVHIFSRRGFETGPQVHQKGGGKESPESVFVGPRLLRELVRAAGGPKDPRVQALWQEHRDQLGPTRHALKESQREIQSALNQEPFDRTTFERALQSALEARHRADSLANEGAVDLAAQLTHAERQRVQRPFVPGPPPPPRP